MMMSIKKEGILKAIQQNDIPQLKQLLDQGERLNIHLDKIGDSGTEQIGEALKSNHTLTMLDITYANVGNLGTEKIGDALKVNRTLTDLNLEWNSIGSQGIEKLAAGLKDNCTLTNLNLRANHFYNPGAEKLGEALKSNQTLSVLTLSYTGMSDSGAEKLGEGLKENHALTKLYLVNNEIGDLGGGKIGEALKNNHSLILIELDSNKIGNSGGEKIGEGLKENHTLRELILSDNKIGDTGAANIGESLKVNHTLTHLNLGRNQIGELGAIKIGEGLKENRGLRVLYISGNKIGAMGAEKIGEALKENNTLTHLDFNNQMGVTGTEKLITFLKNNHTLAWFGIGSNQLGDKGAENISQILRKNRTLIRITMHSNQISDSGAESIAETLNNNNTIVNLNLYNNQIGDKGAQKLATALKSNYTLIEFDLSSNKISAQNNREINDLLKRNRQLKDRCINALKQDDLSTAQQLLQQGVSANGVLIELAHADNARLEPIQRLLDLNDLNLFRGGIIEGINEAQRRNYNEIVNFLEQVLQGSRFNVQAVQFEKKGEEKKAEVYQVTAAQQEIERKPVQLVVEKEMKKGVAMQTKTFGLSEREFNVQYENEKSGSINPLHHHGWEAVKNYRTNRENGKKKDNPSYKFPRDGKYTWSMPQREYSKVQYTEGSKDKAWMEEKDRNYLNRLVHEKANNEKEEVDKAWMEEKNRNYLNRLAHEKANNEKEEADTEQIIVGREIENKKRAEEFGVKMKTQSFGLCHSMKNNYSCASITDHKPRYWIQGNGKLEEKINKPEDKCRIAAVDDYRKYRENGETQDSPDRAFPNDGNYTWKKLEDVYSDVLYAEGPRDKVWMEEKDHKYLTRLARKREEKQEENNRISSQEAKMKRVADVVKRKTQTFGVSPNVLAKPFSDDSMPHSRSIKHAKKTAINNYRECRENGEECDNPPYKFPCDGQYMWETPDQTWSKIKYIAGPQDKAWMEEKDHNYLTRIEQEKENKQEFKKENPLEIERKKKEESERLAAVRKAEAKTKAEADRLKAEKKAQLEAQEEARKKAEAESKVSTMKTQMFGLSYCYSIPYTIAPGDLRPELYFITTSSLPGESLKNYRACRENGEEQDLPNYAFPNDGEYTWENPAASNSKIRYTEGLKDKVWMEEKDHNYLTRIEQEKENKQEVKKEGQSKVEIEREKKKETERLAAVRKAEAKTKAEADRLKANKKAQLEAQEEARKKAEADKKKKAEDDKKSAEIEKLERERLEEDRITKELEEAEKEVEKLKKLEKLESLKKEREKLKQKLSQSNEEKISSQQASQPSSNGRVIQNAEEKNFDQSYLIPYQELEFGAELGQGGFGTVYRGEWQTAPVAIKQLFINRLSEDALGEFKEEAFTMTKLHHPNVMTLYGVSIDKPGCYSLVMEYMPKGSLFSILHNKQPLSWDLRYQISMDICGGLLHLHSKNILHRDLKSMNVLLDDRMRAKLSDFGLSKLRTESTTTATQAGGSAVGTIPWMAPELFKRKGRDTRASDIYSLGMVFWEIVSRTIPFSEAKDPMMIIAWKKDGENEDIPEDCPPKYGELISQCWREKDQRPTIQALAQSLKAIFQPTDEQASSSVLQSGPVYQFETKKNVNESGPVYQV